ncbi:MAG: hypothetical protein ABI596_14860 [Pyrinomonadaceae bacterium]
MTSKSSDRLGDYTSFTLENIVVALTFFPIAVLIYFYSALPESIPVFMNLRGDVEVSAAKSIISVFRVPAMAIDLQLLLLLMKYGTIMSQRKLSSAVNQDYLKYQGRATLLTARLWDSFRLLGALKMASESVYVVFINDERMDLLWNTVRLTTWAATLLAIVAAVYFGYRLLMLKREMKGPDTGDQIDKTQLLAGFIYFNPDDPAPFVSKYALNFANKWVYALLVCIAAYPLLVFSASW